ncbi:ferritin light chain, oocyte isoform-like isoform X2 [Lates calcarifer]|uniref:Ferritin light chain, oocyte isoform-like isoform X2 n=1 Tax=Lates calcarifer TaxID=8187 RepID=A0AAJ8BD90_LATCA|nr:ferritin light chain, oocyte isoform-like isoform X2 [Lates calcarifer]
MTFPDGHQLRAAVVLARHGLAFRPPAPGFMTRVKSFQGLRPGAQSSAFWDTLLSISQEQRTFTRQHLSLIQFSRGNGNKANSVRKPGCEAVCAVLPALELLLLQLKEETGVLVELSQLAREQGDPHTASVVKSHFLAPRVDRLKLLGDLLTSARRVGCTNDQTGGFGEYILNELQEELTR